jgi:hypothetical protein
LQQRLVEADKRAEEENAKYRRLAEDTEELKTLMQQIMQTQTAQRDEMREAVRALTESRNFRSDASCTSASASLPVSPPVAPVSASTGSTRSSVKELYFKVCAFGKDSCRSCSVSQLRLTLRSSVQGVVSDIANEIMRAVCSYNEVSTATRLEMLQQDREFAALSVAEQRDHLTHVGGMLM